MENIEEMEISHGFSGGKEVTLAIISVLMHF